MNNNHNTDNYRLIQILSENDLHAEMEKSLPRVFFTDNLETTFWGTDLTPFHMQGRAISTQEMLLLRHVFDCVTSPEIRAELVKVRPDLKIRSCPRFHAGKLHDGDSVCLVRRRSGNGCHFCYILMTFYYLPVKAGKQQSVCEPSPLSPAETSFREIRRHRAALDRVFFTSDTHFTEEKIIRYRPRFSSVKEMDECIIQRWNEVVPPDGIVFHLGDFSDTPIDNITRIARQLNGTIYLVPGNHDNSIQSKHLYREGNGIIICLEHQKCLQYKCTRIIMSHYPLLCYPRCYSGNAWQLFGHVHMGAAVPGNDTPRLQYLLPFQYDVGVDNNDYRPISLRQVKEIMEQRKEALEG